MESLRDDETDDDCGRRGEPHDGQSMQGCLRTLVDGSIDDGLKLGRTNAVFVSKLAKPGAKLVVGAHQRVSSEASSRASAFFPRS